MSGTYGQDLAWAHHTGFGGLARHAAETLVRALHRAGFREGLVADLGCGSGILARRLAESGYDVVGFDPSEAMLRLAAAEAPAARIVEASLAEAVAGLPAPCVAVTAVGEIVNYAGEDLGTVFGGVAGALAPGGLFLLDVAGPGRRRAPAGVHDGDGWLVAVRHTEHAGELTRRISLFRRTEDGGYRRSDVDHTLQLFAPGDVVAALDGAGLPSRRLRGYGLFRTGRGWNVFLAQAEATGSPSTNEMRAMRSDRQPPPE